MSRSRTSYRFIVILSLLIGLTAVAAAAGWAGVRADTLSPGIFEPELKAALEHEAGTMAAPIADRLAAAAAQSSDLWTVTTEDQIARRGRRTLVPETYLVFSVDKARLGQMLARSPLESSNEARKVRNVIELPKPNGTFVRFRVEDSPILSPELANENPRWKTYQAFGIDEPGTSARLSMTDAGFHAYVFAHEGTFSIDPFQANDVENYVVFYKKDFGVPARQFHCRLDELIAGEPHLFEPAPPETFEPDFVHGTQIRTYRLAVATTSEYTAFFRQVGDTDLQAQTRAFNQVVISVNRIDGVYRKELSVRFNLVSGTNLTYVINPETPANYGNNGSSADLTANQTNVDSIIGSANYDVGHLFETGNGGIAQLSSVCGGSKARGLSGLPNPTGDPFDVDYVAHELGHQFGANHTFNAESDCGSSPSAARREPGSAVTIMGYAGICSSVANVQRNSIETFHVYNLTEAITFINGAGAACGTLSTPNSPPVIAALSNYTIPFNTPFSLTASATDADSDPLTYNWEQNDPGASPSNYPGTTDDDDIGLIFRPGFRPYLPVTSGTRSFPSLPYILNNANEAPITFSGTSATGSICAATCITGEDLPSAARTMNFRVSVRDGRGGISDAGTVLTVINTATPFRVTTQNTASTWTGSTNQNITWDVSGTNGGSINTANVKISLSTDGGQTFPTTILATTPNDGSESIVVPNLPTTTARIKVEAVGNVFFDINDVNFTIVAGGPTPTATPTATPTSTPTATPTSTPTSTPTATPTATPTTTPSISGSVSYSIVTKAVPGVLMSGSGSPAVSTLTAADGSYLLTGFGAGAYTVTPSRAAQVCGTSNGIFASDASLVSRHVVGLQALTGDALEAARVAGLPSVSSFDAGLIARRVVGVCDAGNLAGSWRFTPVNRMYPSVTNLTSENYTAYMMGDVNGDWSPAGARPFPVFITDRTVVASVPRMTAAPGSEVIVPFRIDNLAGKTLDAYQFDITYNPAVVTPAQIAAEVTGTLGANLSVVSHSPEPGLLKVAVYGAIPASGDGVYVYLKFMVTGGIGSVSPLVITDLRVNDGLDEITTVDGRIVVGHEVDVIAE